MMGSKKKLPSVGDTFAFQLENGMYGACRVLRFIEENPQDKASCDAVLVACCDWIADSIPDPSEIDLKPIMRLTHHRWDKSCVNWVISPIPNSFIHIGTISPSSSELLMPCESTVKWSYYPIQRLSQWEWDNDREKEG
jgi:hypothetical protein